MDKKKENRLIEKIKKLFALANNKGATGAESQNAMRMANNLLAKHSLSMGQVAGGTDDVFCSFKDYNIKTPGTKTVVSSVCALYNCRVIFDHTWEPAKTLVIGTEANRITAIIVIEQLLDQINKDCKGKNAAFKHGAAIGLGEVCAAIIKERKADTKEIIPGTGLVPLDQIKQQKLAVSNFIDENFANLKSSKKARGSQEGAVYGRGLNPGARVGGAVQRRLK